MPVDSEPTIQQSDKQSSTDEILAEIKSILERAHPAPNESLAHRIYVKAQMCAKYLGIPALIIAAIVPVYDMANGIRASLANDLMISVYTSYATQLLEDGQTDRAENVLQSLNVNEKTDPAVHYAKAKVAVSQALLKAENVPITEDLINILIQLNRSSNLLTGTYGDGTDYVRLNIMLSEVRIAQGLYAEALSVLIAVEDEVMLSPIDVRANFFLKKGTIFVWQHDYLSAKQELEKAMTTIDGSESFKELSGEILFQTAKNEQFDRNFEQAITQYTAAEIAFRESSQITGQIKTLNNLGMIYFDRLYNGRDIRRALAYYQSSLSLSKKSGDLVSVARAQYNIAAVEHQQGSVKDALQTYILALEHFKEANNLYGTTLAHSSLGKVYDILEDFEKGYFHSREAFDGFINLQDKKNIGMQAGQTAEAAKALGNERDFVIYDYLSYVYRRATNDSKAADNLQILRNQKQLLGEEVFANYIAEAEEFAREINLTIQEVGVNLDLPADL